MPPRLSSVAPSTPGRSGILPGAVRKPAGRPRPGHIHRHYAAELFPDFDAVVCFGQSGHHPETGCRIVPHHRLGRGEPRGHGPAGVRRHRRAVRANVTNNATVSVQNRTDHRNAHPIPTGNRRSSPSPGRHSVEDRCRKPGLETDELILRTKGTAVNATYAALGRACAAAGELAGRVAIRPAERSDFAGTDRGRRRRMAAGALGRLVAAPQGQYPGAPWPVSRSAAASASRSAWPMDCRTGAPLCSTAHCK